MNDAESARKRSGSLAAGTILVFASGSVWSADLLPQLPTTVCEIAQHPERFDGKLVRVAGFVRSDGLENTLIIDGSCSDTGIGFKYSDTASKSPTARRLHDAIYFTGNPGARDKEISVTLSGKFLWNSSGGPPRLIVVNKVSHLRVSKKRQ
jgi:hypothetical protein